jgi:hypothetical protein
LVFNDPSRGNSGAVVSRALVKRWPALKGRAKSLPELVELLTGASERSRRILFLEDCIMSGDQCIRLLRGQMAGIASKNLVHLRFAVGTAYGIARLRHYLNQNGLVRVSVTEPGLGFIPNLTPDALDLAERGNLFDAQVRIQGREKHVIPGISLQGKKILNWNAMQRQGAQRFCRFVGKQLMFYHYQSSGESPERAEELAQENSLGFHDLGLLVAFAHGVPDNTIPLFRCGGRVSVDGLTVDWVPLFPNATGF